MGTFSFIALTAQGDVVRGEIKAQNANEVSHLLKTKNLNIVRVNKEKTSPLKALLNKEISLSPPLTTKEEILLLSTLGELIDASLPMTRALDVCHSVQSRKDAKKTISALLDHIHQGKSLSDAMVLKKPCFDDRLIALVRAGEESGQLAPALLQAALGREKRHKQATKIKGALYYPAFLVVMTILAIGLLVGFVLPQFEPLFQQAGEDLPAVTRGVQIFANLVVDYGPWSVGLIAMSTLLLALARNDPRVHLKTDRALLSVPLVGKLIRISSIATLCHTLGSQLRHGVPLERALELAQKTQSNMAMATALKSINDLIHRGRPLSAAFKGSALYPDLLIHMLKVGEETGNMPHALLRVAHILDAQIDERTQRLTGLLVPLITLFLGLIVGLIVFAVMAAVMGVTKLT